MADQPSDQTTATVASSTDNSGQSLRTRLGAVIERSWQHRLGRLLILSGLVAATFSCVLAVRWIMIGQQLPPPPELSLTLALEQLDAGAVEQAREIAVALRGASHLTLDERGGPAYVLGVVTSLDAQSPGNQNERRSWYLLAARYLEESRADGFPPGRGGHGDFLLGKCLWEAGRYAASVPALLQALSSFPEREAEIHAMLAQAYLRQSPAEPDQALRHNSLFLATLETDPPQRLQALLTQAEIEFQLGRHTTCQQTLDQIPPGTEVAAQSALLRGRLILVDGDEALRADDVSREEAEARAAMQYAAAREVFEAVLRQHPSGGEAARQASYLLGVSLRQLKDWNAAEQRFSQTRRAHYDSPEGLAAGLQEAELQQLSGNQQAAIASFGRVFRQAADQPVYNNPWLTLDELRARGEQAYQVSLQTNNYLDAVALAEALAPLLSPERAIELQADARHAHAVALSGAGFSQRETPPPPAPAGAMSAEALHAWVQAASLYEQLAKLRFATRQYPETLWRGATAYLQGRDFRRATGLLQKYLQHEVRHRHPPALLALGEAWLALDDPTRALASLGECIEFFPQDPHTYRARVIAAKAHCETDNLAAAQKLLVDNLEHESLTPRSTEWRDSLYALGQSYYQQGLREETSSRSQFSGSRDTESYRNALKALESAQTAFQQAIARLSEAVQRDQLNGRDPCEADTLEASYLIADAHRHAARLPLTRLSTVTIETTRNQLNSEIQRELTAAEAMYRSLQQQLNTKQDIQPLNQREQQILRNSYFARADVLYDLEILEEAIQAYATATNRYQHEPEALEAYVQIANCQRLLNRQSEARGTLEQAKVVLQRIRADADFASTTRYSREEWQQLLDWLTTL